MARLPEKTVLNGSKTPKTTTGEMKDALGKLRDYLNDLLGDDSADKEGARMALGVDLMALTGKIDAKADREAIETAILGKADRTELNDKAQELETAIAKRGTPVGSIEFFAMTIPPSGYLKADGAPVGRQTYPDLFDAIGTTFGAGDGVSTFNLPDLMDRFPQGSITPGQRIESGLPNIVGSMYPDYGFAVHCTGALQSKSGSNGMRVTPDVVVSNKFVLDASLSNSIYGASDTVQPPSLTLLPCIKAFDAATNPGLIDMTGLANDVADLSANKLNKTADGKMVRYIADAFSDGTNWYRQWSDGWVEQGGTMANTNAIVTLSFLVPFTDNKYSIFKNLGSNGSGVPSDTHLSFFNLSAVSAQTTMTTVYLSARWYACGQGA